jgi:hypothetical protein
VAKGDWDDNREQEEGSWCGEKGKRSAATSNQPTQPIITLHKPAEACEIKCQTNKKSGHHIHPSSNHISIYGNIKNGEKIID